jgi:hypothetical protein
LCARKPTKRGFRSDHFSAIPVVDEHRPPLQRLSADRGCNPHNNTVIKRAPPWKLGSFIKFGLINAQSVGNKTTALCEHVMECAFDVAAITETWLRDGDDPLILNLCPPGFTYLVCNRPTTKSKGRGGGLAFLVRSSILCKQ